MQRTKSSSPSVDSNDEFVVDKVSTWIDQLCLHENAIEAEQKKQKASTSKRDEFKIQDDDDENFGVPDDSSDGSPGNTEEYGCHSSSSSSSTPEEGEAQERNEMLTDPQVIFGICHERIKLVANLTRVPEIGNVCPPTLKRKLLRLSRVDLDNRRHKVMKICISIGSRIVSDLVQKFTESHHMVSAVWNAIRQRGCQFLGPAIQDEVIRLILITMEDGAELTRKVLLMYLVQRLKPFYPKAISKTAVGHVVQIFYRASCFDIIPQENTSSLMQLKPEFRNYEALRREHDSQIVSMGLEAGIKICPEQWSCLLYGDRTHLPHMQSIVDRLEKMKPSFDVLLQKLKYIICKQNDPHSLLEIMIYFEQLAYIEKRIKDDEGILTVDNVAIAMDAVNFITIKFMTLFRDFEEQKPSSTHSTPRRMAPLRQQLSA